MPCPNCNDGICTNRCKVHVRQLIKEAILHIRCVKNVSHDNALALIKADAALKFALKVSEGENS